jgi:hypothetical protein
MAWDFSTNPEWAERLLRLREAVEAKFADKLAGIPRT